jgi:hypothetical protein
MPIVLISIFGQISDLVTGHIMAQSWTVLAGYWPSPDEDVAL